MFLVRILLWKSFTIKRSTRRSHYYVNVWDKFAAKNHKTHDYFSDAPELFLFLFLSPEFSMINKEIAAHLVEIINIGDYICARSQQLTTCMYICTNEWGKIQTLDATGSTRFFRFILFRSIIHWFIHSAGEWNFCTENFSVIHQTREIFLFCSRICIKWVEVGVKLLKHFKYYRVIIARSDNFN